MMLKILDFFLVLLIGFLKITNAQFFRFLYGLNFVNKYRTGRILFLIIVMMYCLLNKLCQYVFTNYAVGLA